MTRLRMCDLSALRVTLQADGDDRRAGALGVLAADVVPLLLAPEPAAPRRVAGWAPCVPVPWARPRFDGRSGRAFTSARAEKGAKAQAALLRAASPAEPLVGPVSLRLAYTMPVPASWSKVQRERALAIPAPFHGIKPDLDNLAKNTIDALTRLRWWRDDAQVARIEVSKRYGAEPGVHVVAEEL